MKFKTHYLLATLACALSAQAQGFINLDFESANVPDIPSGQSGGQVATTDGIPGWTAYYGTDQTTQILHNDGSLGAVNISILGPNSDFPILEGSYSVELQAGAWINFQFVPATIAQTSLIPLTTQSILLKINSGVPISSGFGLTLGGQSISLVALMNTSSYTLYGGDISNFAGQTEELRVSASPTPTYNHNSFVIDSIEFSPAAIPEPGVFGLFAFGALLLGLRISANNHNYFSDRTMAAWGRNNFSQTNVPTSVTNVIAIAAGGDQSLALLGDGTVTNWGANFGPIPSSVTNVMAIAAGTNFCVVLRSNGTVIAWGNNSNGQTNVPSGLTNVVAVAAGGAHALALKPDGTVVAWGSNGAGETNVPATLTNAMAVAAGYAHSMALRNNGTIVEWGDNSASQTNVPAWLGPVKLIAAGGNQSLASMFSPLIQYPVDVTKDVLLIYNTNSTDSSNVWYYYMQHRPMVTGANVLGIGCTNAETALPDEFTNQISAPILQWLSNHPTLHPQYIILFLDIPTRVSTVRIQDDPPTHPSVSVMLYERYPGWKPFITHLNMGDTNACKAYINKLESIGATNSPGKLILSASVGVYGNTNYYFDDNRANPPYGSGPSTGGQARDGVLNALTNASITYVVDNNSAKITNGVRVAAYFSWGGHSTLGADYPIDGTIVFGTNSSWYLIGTLESFNGRRSSPEYGTFVDWYSSNAFGGTNYASTPIGAVCHVNEPGFFGNNANSLYGLWAQGKSLGACAWHSRVTPYLQVVGDPLVQR